MAHVLLEAVLAAIPGGLGVAFRAAVFLSAVFAGDGEFESAAWEGADLLFVDGEDAGGAEVADAGEGVFDGHGIRESWVDVGEDGGGDDDEHDDFQCIHGGLMIAD